MSYKVLGVIVRYKDVLDVIVPKLNSIVMSM